MPNTTNPTTYENLEWSERDRIAYEYRQSGLPWGRIAGVLGYANESSARTAGNRHAARIGAEHGYVANGAAPTRRTTRTPRTHERGFGVEIEFVNGLRQDIADAVQRATGQTHVPITGYHGTTCVCCGMRVRNTMWKLEYDGSVADGSGVRNRGGEVVTPPLKGEAGLNLLREVMTAMREAGAEVDQRCGMHVHIATDDMDNQQRAMAIHTLFGQHDMLDRLVAPSRHTNSYCRKPDGATVQNWVHQMQTYGRIQEHERRRSINVCSFAKYGTIEIRYHQGTLNGRKAQTWVKFLLALFATAKNDEQDTLPTGLALLGQLVDNGRLEQSDAAYLTRRVAELSRR